MTWQSDGGQEGLGRHTARVCVCVCVVGEGRTTLRPAQEDQQFTIPPEDVTPHTHTHSSCTPKKKKKKEITTPTPLNRWDPAIR